MRGVLKFLFSRSLWTFIGLVVLSVLIWVFGPLFAIDEYRPLESELSRIIVIAVIFLIWLLRILFQQIRAAKANQNFVADLAQPTEEADPGAEGVSQVNEKFLDVLSQMRRSKLGGRRFLREIPWYVMIGPPGTGKTTALQQSGLHFPIDLSDDLKGVGGTRNCDWFFTEDAILIDTAGRYVQQQSDPRVDAEEWGGFLELLRKHRGRRSLNGVIVTLSVKELLGDEATLRDHGREIRRRLTELSERLGIRVPVYLLITKVDLIPGFEAFFSNLNTSAKEQVWGATLPVEVRVDGSMIDRELRALQARLEDRLPSRMASDVPLEERGMIFRFPSEVARLKRPLKALSEVIFAESRYEETPWLRGFYMTSATQEGTPIDRMVGRIAESFGISTPRSLPRRHSEARSYFLRELLTDVIFEESGLGTFDPRAEDRRRWIWRGSLAGATLVTLVAAVFFIFSFQRYSGAMEIQADEFASLSGRLANVAARQVPTDPLDIAADYPRAIAAATDVRAAEIDARTGSLTTFGPSARSELDFSQTLAYEHTLRNILEPRMLGLLEATMWHNVRDADYLVDAIKAYQMMTGLAPYDSDFFTFWWQEVQPAYASTIDVELFPTESARTHQLAAIERMSIEEDRFDHDPILMTAALESVCDLHLATRAYQMLLRQPEVQALDPWIPAQHAGPNGPRVFSRLSGDTLRVGLDGIFTYDAFHDVVLRIVPEIAADFTLDRIVFAGGCANDTQMSEDVLIDDILKLYFDDFIAQWDSLLRDIRLAQITDLRVASANLADLADEDSAMRRLLTAVVAETHLTRPSDAEAGALEGEQAAPGLLERAESRLNRVLGMSGQDATSFGVTGLGQPTVEEAPGERVTRHFEPIRGMVLEIDGVAPRIGEVEVALTALAGEIHTIMAGPNPEQAILNRGGLPALIGAMANVARTMPDPIDDWLLAVAGDATEVTRAAIIDQLNARVRTDILPFCNAATNGRYPFDPSSGIDVNIADFARLFGGGGIFDTFMTEHLGQYVDTTNDVWVWRQDFGLDPSFLVPFRQAKTIQNALFPGGSGPSISFVIEPRDLSANASRVTLVVDGQTLTYANAATAPAAMTWPGPNATNLVSLSFTPLDGSGEVLRTERGAWALLRLMRNSGFTGTDLPEVFRLRLSARGYSALFELQAGSIENPFDMELFSGFECPEAFE